MCEEVEDEAETPIPSNKDVLDSVAFGKPKLSKSAEVVTSAVQELASRTKSYEDSSEGQGNINIHVI